jgi:hypothetical protein
MRRNKTLYTYWKLFMQFVLGITCGKHHAFYATPQKKRWEISCVEVFSQELEDLRQEPFKNGENHKLEDFKNPLDYTLSVCIRLLSVVVWLLFCPILRIFPV